MVQDFVLSVALTPDGNWVLSGSKDRGVQFWDPRTANAQLMLQGHKNSGKTPPINPQSYPSWTPAWLSWKSLFRDLRQDSRVNPGSLVRFYFQ